MSNNTWIEKYRPNSINEVYYHINIINTLKKLINLNKPLHIILYGYPGTGKTSTILSFCKQLYGNNYKNMILELNGSDDRGIKTIREKIKDFSEYNHIFYKKIKIVILDEADSMTFEAQNALRSVIERTTNTRFCLICNYLSKIIPELQSRCNTLRFENIDSINIKKKLKEILINENLNYDESIIDHIIDHTKGDMRKSINCLQILNPSNIKYFVKANHNNLFQYIKNNDLKDSIKFTKKYLLKNNIILSDILKNIYKYINNFKLSNEKIYILITKLTELEVYINNNDNNNTIHI